jgi:hypothetical protein
MARRTRWALLLALMLVGSATMAGSANAGSSVDTSGIEVVGPDALQFRATDEAQAMAFDGALNLAYANRADMGYPWIDFAAKTLDLTVFDDAGQKAALLAEGGLDAAGLTIAITSARASIAKLDAIADDATRLVEAGVPNADLIWMTEPDQMNNRVVITVSKLDAALMSALASRFGTDLIAVRVRPGGPAAAANRDSDAPAFWGGAYFTTSTGKACTTGFAWNAGDAGDMITAAHCISTGGTISYPNYSNVGTVRSGYEENWSDANGTQYYTGQSVYRGDVALIRYPSYHTGPYIYSGAPHTSTYSAVAAIHSRFSQFGDAACIDGVVTGEWCGMVTQTGANIWYVINGFSVWARNVVEADALGPSCPTHGDSGAPVYQKRSDGKVTALGILSGSLPLGVDCGAFFTDIWDAYYGLPGNLKVTG